MKEEENKSASGKVVGGIVFFVGFIGALVIGWVVYPSFLYSEKAQPINFSHVAHQDTTCEDCHAFRPDGTYVGIPKIDKCKECHESQMGKEKSEQILVEEYIQKDREVPWLVYAYQPDNVYFSHAPHQAKGVKCESCHRQVKDEKTVPLYYEDRLSGYSKTTMRMIDCEKCHVEQNGSNNCEICHK
jgi:menaquinone reductase, multiheme cytochrome c subunit